MISYPSCRCSANASKAASEEISDYLSSLPKHTPVHVLAHSIRVHWSVDVAMQEDAAQSYKNQGPHTQNVLRHMALQMLKSETSVKVAVQAKRKGG